MVDFGFAGTSFIEARNNDLAKRREVAKMFNDFRAANPYATYEDYQMFLDTVAPDRFLQGGITQEHMRRMADQNAIRKQRDDARIAIEDRRKEFEFEKLQSDTIQTAIERAASTSKEGEDVRKLVIDMIGPEATRNPRVASMIAGMDIEGEVRRRRLEKSDAERKRVFEMANTFDDPNKSPEEIERDLLLQGRKPEEAAAVSGQIKKKRDDDYNTKKSGLVDELTKDGSIGHIVLGEQAGDLPSLIRQRAENKGIKLRPEDDRAIAGQLQSRRDEYERIATNQFQESLGKLQALANDETKTEDESVVRQKYANLPKRQQDYVVAKWKENRQAYLAKSKDEVMGRLDDAKDTDLRNVLQDGNRQQIEQRVKSAIERVNPSLAKDQDFINQTVDDLMKRGATRAGEAAVKYGEANRAKVESDFEATSKDVKGRLEKIAGDAEKQKDMRRAAAYKIGSLVADQTNMSDTEIMNQVEAYIAANPNAKDDIGKAASAIVANNGNRTKQGAVAQTINNRSGLDMSTELATAREAGVSAEATSAQLAPFRQNLQTRVDELGRPVAEEVIFRGIGNGTKAGAETAIRAAMQKVADQVKRIDTVVNSPMDIRYNRGSVSLDDFQAAKMKLIGTYRDLEKTLSMVQGWKPYDNSPPQRGVVDKVMGPERTTPWSFSETPLVTGARDALNWMNNTRIPLDGRRRAYTPQPDPNAPTDIEPPQ